MNFVEEYIKAIENGEIIVNKHIRHWYCDKLKPIIEGKDEKYYFDEKAGNRFIKFCEKYCKQSKGDWYGKPLKLMLFQKAKWQAIFGVKNKSDKLRRFKVVFDERGRKNGKSTENSALGLFLPLSENGGEIYVAATTAAQARRVWNESQSMISKSEELADVFGSKVFPTPTITCIPTESTYMVLSSNVDALDGLNVSGAIIDEIHALQRDIYDVLKQATGARRKSLMSMITTNGKIREGLFDDQREYALQVLYDIVDDITFFPLLYELDEEDIKGDSWKTDESCWIKANPGLDVIKQRDYLRENIAQIAGDPNFESTVKTKDFNIPTIGGAKPWLAYDVLNNTSVYSDEELKRFDNTIVLGGYDLSKTGDMTAFTTLLFDKENHKVIAITMYWITADFLEKQRLSKSKIPWDAWIQRGYVRLSGTHAIDYHDITKYVLENFQRHGWMYQYINYDSWSAQYLVEELAQYGYSKDFCQIPTIQGFKTLSIPMQTMEVHLREKVLCYQNNPVTKWHLSNVELEEDRNGNMMPKKNSGKIGKKLNAEGKENKQSSSMRKIDGAATILNCYVSLCQNIDYYL